MTTNTWQLCSHDNKLRSHDNKHLAGSCVPRPTLLFILQFVLTIINGSRRAVQNGKALEYSSPDGCTELEK